MSAPGAAPVDDSQREIDPARGDWFWQFARMIARPFVTLMFDLKVYGAQNIPTTGGVLLVANHQSFLDPVFIGVYLRRPMSYLARSGLFEQKYFAWLIRRLRAFPVRQGAGDIGAVKEMVRRLKEGHVLSLFPEGSRTEDGELGPIEPGAALVIRRAAVAVVPVAIDGSFDAWPKGQKLFRAHPVRVLYGPPMNLAGMKSDQISKAIEITLRNMIADLRGRRKP
jgi:1-acyl-sn-glycerol-3-phosphate acyltransferase